MTEAQVGVAIAATVSFSLMAVYLIYRWLNREEKTPKRTPRPDFRIVEEIHNDGFVVFYAQRHVGDGYYMTIPFSHGTVIHAQSSIDTIINRTVKNKIYYPYP